VAGQHAQIQRLESGSALPPTRRKRVQCTDTGLHCSRPENLFENLRVIFLTGKDDPAVRSQALAAGASAFFLKGEPNEEFLAGIQAAIPWS